MKLRNGWVEVPSAEGGRLDRHLQPLLALTKFLCGKLALHQVIADLVLPLPRTQRGFDSTDQSEDADRPLKQDHIPQRRPLLRHLDAVDASYTTASEDNQREV